MAGKLPLLFVSLKLRERREETEALGGLIQSSSPSISILWMLEVMGLKEAMWDIFDEYFWGNYLLNQNQTSVHSFPWQWKAMGASGQANSLVSGTNIYILWYLLSAFVTTECIDRGARQQTAYVQVTSMKASIFGSPGSDHCSSCQELSYHPRNYTSTSRADSNSASTSREGKAGDL